MDLNLSDQLVRGQPDKVSDPGHQKDTSLLFLMLLRKSPECYKGLYQGVKVQQVYRLTKLFLLTL